MNLTVTPGNALRGALALPGDKSLSHRSALLAALCEGENHIENFLVSGVTRAMLTALTALGVPWELAGTALRVQGKGLEGLRSQARKNGPVWIDCGNSATTMRLLAGALAAAGIPAVLDGSPGLRRRPMDRIVAPLLEMGVDIQATNGCAPLLLQPSTFPLKPITYQLPVASAQVKSCLLLAGLVAAGTTTLIEPGPSRDHTERMLRSMGIEVTSHQFVTRLTPPQRLSLPALSLALPGDFSSAAFPIVAALVTPGSEITLKSVGLNPTRTGLLDALRAMGADIEVVIQEDRHGEPVGDLTVRYSPLRATRVSGALVVRMIDEFPAFAVAAAHAEGQTTVCEAEELRHKESDRIGALCSRLRRLGVEAEESPDGFIIRGGQAPLGGQVDSSGDHRLAMAFAVAGLASRGPVTVAGAEMISESYPGFVETLQSLGGRIE